ncbi:MULTISPECIES: hypothetical protein [Pseudomonadota]|uniref:hypothetical protein n=1 Tax=Pseudomonadota TaxID=1224 RepID=UPI0032997196
MDRAALLSLRAAPDNTPAGLLTRFCRAAMKRYCIGTDALAAWFGVPESRIWNELASSDDREAHS